MKHLDLEWIAIDYPFWKQKRLRINIFKIGQDILKTIMTCTVQLIAIILLSKTNQQRWTGVLKRASMSHICKKDEIQCTLKIVMRMAFSSSCQLVTQYTTMARKKTKARVEMFTYSKFSNASSIIVAILWPQKISLYIS